MSSSLEIQRMIRDMANETRDVLTTIAPWEEEIQRRDDELIQMAKSGNVANKTPQAPQRPAAAKPPPTKAPVKIEVSTEKQSPPPKAKATPGRGAPAMTYEEWSKLDTKLAKELEKDEQEPKETAESHRIAGNDFFKKRKYELAIREYTAAIRLDASNAVYYNNRATASYQISSFADAERDATKAIELDPRYCKAFIRRGLSREALGKLELALRDLESALDLDPHITEVQRKVLELRRKLGISEDGRIREVREPKIKIVDEDVQETPRQRVQVVEEKEEPEPVWNPPSSQPRPKVVLVDEDEPPKPAPQPKRRVVIAEDDDEDWNTIPSEKPKPEPEPPKSRIRIVEDDDDSEWNTVITKPRVVVVEDDEDNDKKST